VKKLRELSEDELLARTWLPDPVAKAVFSRLHGLDTPERARPRSGGATMDEP
ncbi:MAG: hypothetical protein QOI44_1046, partial [Actinomycetota bacterium]|nr:hypothetical protein [Actinomycetota bacterium]